MGNWTILLKFWAKKEFNYVSKLTKLADFLDILLDDLVLKVD